MKRLGARIAFTSAKRNRHEVKITATVWVRSRCASKLTCGMVRRPSVAMIARSRERSTMKAVSPKNR
ncbi:hypothetical protein D3C72_2041880 [compost metagenome]